MPTYSENFEMPTQPIRKNRLHKFLHKNLKIPRSLTQPFLLAGRIAGNPSQYWLRKRMAREIVKTSKQLMNIPQKDGFRLFGPDDIEEPGQGEKQPTANQQHRHVAKALILSTRNHERRFHRSIFKNTLVSGFSFPC